MLKKLRLERFKNFQEAELTLGPLTVLVGTNASGKSNIRDAFRFLHGISRNYNLAEIFGEKWVEGGILQDSLAAAAKSPKSTVLEIYLINLSPRK